MKQFLIIGFAVISLCLVCGCVSGECDDCCDTSASFPVQEKWWE